jgi:hypothetical protein
MLIDVGRMRVASEVFGDLAIVEIGRGRGGGRGGSRDCVSATRHQKYQLADFRSWANDCWILQFRKRNSALTTERHAHTHHKRPHAPSFSLHALLLDYRVMSVTRERAAGREVKANGNPEQLRGTLRAANGSLWHFTDRSPQRKGTKGSPPNYALTFPTKTLHVFIWSPYVPHANLILPAFIIKVMFDEAPRHAIISSLLLLSASSSSVICQTTGPQPLPKRFLHLMRSRASSFKWE